MHAKTLNWSGTVLLICSFLMAGAVWGQRESPLVYTDPEFGWLDNRDPDSPRISPSSVVGIQLGSTRIMITYGSPGVKDRKIFGGLVPYGTVWRTGADEATTITFTGDVVLEGHPVPAGTYSLFTIPGKTEWVVILNKVNNQWGAFQYDKTKDLLRIKIPSEQAPSQERLAFRFEAIDAESASAMVAIHWTDAKVGFTIAEAE